MKVSRKSIKILPKYEGFPKYLSNNKTVEIDILGTKKVVSIWNIDTRDDNQYLQYVVDWTEKYPVFTPGDMGEENNPGVIKEINLADISSIKIKYIKYNRVDNSKKYKVHKNELGRNIFYITNNDKPVTIYTNDDEFVKVLIYDENKAKRIAYYGYVVSKETDEENNTYAIVDAVIGYKGIFYVETMKIPESWIKGIFNTDIEITDTLQINSKNNYKAKSNT